MSRKYEVPVTTKEVRKEQVENALAMSGLAEKKLTPFMIRSYEQYIAGDLTQEEMMNQAIRKFNQEYEEQVYEITLKKEVLLEYAAEVLSEFRRYFIKHDIEEMKVVNNEVTEKYKKIILLRNDIATSKYKTLEDLKEVEFKLKESKKYIDVKYKELIIL